MDTQEIQAVHAVLHLVSHRNKNQHQRANWWKWLSRLKRTAVELGSQNASATIPAAYKQYLSTHLIPRCYLYVLLSSTCAGRTLATDKGSAART
jgi:ribonuclease MRP protein subunit RMP1